MAVETMILPLLPTSCLKLYCRLFTVVVVFILSSFLICFFTLYLSPFIFFCFLRFQTSNIAVYLFYCRLYGILYLIYSIEQIVVSKFPVNSVFYFHFVLPTVPPGFFFRLFLFFRSFLLFVVVYSESRT